MSDLGTTDDSQSQTAWNERPSGAEAPLFTTFETAMTFFRHVIIGLSLLIASWAIASFAGVLMYLEPPEFWTTSLMWALLASIVVMPILMIGYHANERALRAAVRKQLMQKESVEQPPAFVNETDDRDRLWPSARK